MGAISNDSELKAVLSALEPFRQRQLGARLIEQVLDLVDDERLQQVLRIAINEKSSDDELAMALRMAKAVSLERHTRCGSDADWSEQAGYFVARAAEALVSPDGAGKGGGAAWQAAMNCRLARNCALLSSGQTEEHQESEAQYQIISDLINE